jgi:hypothetical protein
MFLLVIGVAHVGARKRFQPRAKSVPLVVMVPESDKAEADAFAELDRRTLSSFVRVAISEKIERMRQAGLDPSRTIPAGSQPAGGGDVIR